MRKIKDGYDAYWFIHDHPKLQRRERSEIDPAKAGEMEKSGHIITRDRGGKCWREWRHLRVSAVGENLSIHYAKTDGKRISDDKSKNVHTECWLELGPVKYEYAAEWEDETYEAHYHDWRLDCGGSTFDEALVRLAKLVLRHYGDYKPVKWEDECGKPVCGDCVDIGMFEKRHGLGNKKG